MINVWTELSGLVLGAHDPIVGFGLDGRISSWNSGATQMFGYTPDEMLGQSIGILETAETRDFRELVASIQAGHQIPVYRDTLRTKDGDDRVVSVMVSSVGSDQGELVGALQIMWLIPERLSTDDDLCDSALAASQPMKLVVEARLRQSLTEKLYQPLTAIVAYLESIRRYSSDSDKTLYAAAQQASEQATRAAAIIRKLSKICSKEIYEPETVFVGMLVSELGEMIMEDACRAQVEVEFRLEADAPAFVEPLSIQQVLYNLIRNVVETAARNSSYRVCVSTSRNATHICVEAIGAPYPPAESMPTAFNLTDFEMRALSDELSACQRIVVKHRGELGFENSPAGIILFRCVLPIDPEPAAQKSDVKNQQRDRRSLIDSSGGQTGDA